MSAGISIGVVLWGLPVAGRLRNTASQGGALASGQAAADDNVGSGP